jgi:hypothetical protein
VTRGCHPSKQPTASCDICPPEQGSFFTLHVALKQFLEKIKNFFGCKSQMSTMDYKEEAKFG